MGYSSDINVQILISLLKKHKIKKIVASPGVANIHFVASVQNDSFFEVYSSVDERSAAYIACGMAVESEEPVVISCTGATASRNYMPGLTEAFYRKIPVLAVTSTREISKCGQNIPQMIDRSTTPNDIVKKSVHIPNIQNEKEKNDYIRIINDALLELKRDGGGPVHINLTNNYSRDFNTTDLPNCLMINRFTVFDKLPDIPKVHSIAVMMGAHKRLSHEEIKALEDFCTATGAVVFADQISNYRGKYAVNPLLLMFQEEYFSDCFNVDLMISIGDVYGMDYSKINPKKVWRVNEDGEVRDTFGHLESVFEMKEEFFFRYYADKSKDFPSTDSYMKKWEKEINSIPIPELPYSNIWIAQTTINLIPPKSQLHFGIQNSLRSWNFFTRKDLEAYCNTGGFGIDGCMSSFVGASLCNPDKLYFLVIGDLAFFYDINVLGNRHIGNNIRILLVNNGLGQQFKNPGSFGSIFGDKTNLFIAAGGHHGNQSPDLIKNFSSNLGFQYLAARTKEEFLNEVKHFTATKSEKPILFECFPSSDEESGAMYLIKHILRSDKLMIKKQIKSVMKHILK